MSVFRLASADELCDATGAGPPETQQHVAVLEDLPVIESAADLQGDTFMDLLDVLFEVWFGVLFKATLL